MTGHIRVGGVWKAFDPKMKIAGVWKDATGGWVKVAGTWRKFYPPYVAPQLTLGPRIFDTNAGAHTTATTSTVAGTNLYVIAVSSNYAGSGASVTDSRGGAWTLIQSVFCGSGLHVMQLWARNNTMGDFASLTVTYTPGGTTTGGGLAVIKGVGISSPGTGGIRQSAINSNISSANPPSATLGAAALTTNPLIGAAFGIGGAFTPKSGWTELFDDTYTVPNTYIEVMVINSGETASVITWGSAPSAQKGALVAEFIAA